MSALYPSIISPTRCVLLIMDEGVGVYVSSGRGVSFIDSYHWRESGFEEKLSDAISRSGAVSVVILNDAVEQHYRKEKVPVLSFFDKANIIQRRLNVAFPNFSMRAAVVLKEGTKLIREAAANEKDVVKGDLYLFAAVPSTEAFGRIMSAVSSVDAQIVGYGLLPVESTPLVDALVKKLASRKTGIGGARWSILISQHRGGGLRQIVVRNNELALTRVTPVIEPDPESPGAWAADVSQELQATLSYLSRFGYTPEDGLDIMVVGDSLYTEPLEGMIYAPCNYTTLTLKEACDLIGIRVLDRGEEHFSDALHVGWVGRKAMLDLPLVSREINSIKKPRQAAMAFMVLCSIGVSGVAAYAVDEAMRLYRTTVNIEVAQEQKRKIDEIYAEELKRKESMGIDVPLIKGSLAINKLISDAAIDPLVVLDAISRELQDIRLDGFEFNNTGSEPAETLSPGTNLADRRTELLLKMSFAGSVDAVKGNEELDKLVDRLNSRLEEIGYKAQVNKQLQKFTYDSAVDSQAGIIAKVRAAQDRYNAEVKVVRVKKNG
ncbi:MAG: hypothetical protein AUJ12_01340 [Alphaproteobacteria bacterium CG1_02_46_17]|nr:MAG: hypothetical protein AUJ12_01340 [Alphaproteobacteria bacterium CG1_02_46_17]